MNKAVQKLEAHEVVNAPVTPADMITQALDKGVGVEVMEKLMDMHARWEAAQARKAFDDAMASLREDMPEVIKNQKVDFTTNKGRTNYQYEDLSDVTKALSPAMAKLGLSFRWRTDSGQNGVKVTCIITHRGGHYEETALTAPVDASGNKNPIQAIGSAVTYLQRYTLKAAVGVAADRDDDGRSAYQREEQKPANKPASKDEQARALYATHQNAFRTAKTFGELKTAFEKYWNERHLIPKDWQRDLEREKDERKAEFDAGAAGLAGNSDNDEQFPGDVPFPGDA